MPKIIEVGSVEEPACAFFSHDIEEGRQEHFASDILRAPGPDEFPQEPKVEGYKDSEWRDDHTHGHKDLSKVPSNVSSGGSRDSGPSPTTPKTAFAKVLSNLSTNANARRGSKEKPSLKPWTKVKSEPSWEPEEPKSDGPRRNSKDKTWNKPWSKVKSEPSWEPEEPKSADQIRRNSKDKTWNKPWSKVKSDPAACEVDEPMSSSTPRKRGSKDKLWSKVPSNVSGTSLSKQDSVRSWTRIPSMFSNNSASNRVGSKDTTAKSFGKVPSNTSQVSLSKQDSVRSWNKVMSNKSDTSGRSWNKVMSNKSCQSTKSHESDRPKISRQDSCKSADSQLSALSQISRRLSVASVASHRSESSLLSEDVTPEMLRGVNLNLALQNFKYLYHNIVSKDLYGFSDTVSHLDDFISHDWKTTRWPKFLTLCLLYNAPAAVLASTITGMVLCFLQLDTVAVLPKYSQISPPFTKVIAGKEYKYTVGCWCVFCCPFVFALFFVRWQSIRTTLLRRYRFVFLDKFCIHQSNMELKSKGIRCLAGFLKHSHQLVILWSPRYFTRLWCTYEIASWLHLGQFTKGRTVKLLPIQQSIAVLMMTTGVFSYVVVYCIGWRLLSRVLSGALVAYLVGAVLLLIFPPPNHMSRQLMRDLRMLPAQLASFSVQNAECFCCDNNHIHPDTGEELTCDREVIYLALSEWFTGKMKQKVKESLQKEISDKHSDGGQEAEFSFEFLDAFDNKVRAQFRRWMGATSVETNMSYMHCLVAMCPLSWYGFDLAAGVEVLDLDAAARYLIGDMLVMIFAMLPSGLRLCSLQLSLVDRLCGDQDSCFLDILVTFAVSCANILTFAVLWIPSLYTIMIVSPVPQIVFDVLLVALTVWLFKRQNKEAPRSP